MKHIQARVSDVEYKRIRKKAIDLSVTLEELLRQSVLNTIDMLEKNEVKGGGSSEEAKGNLKLTTNLIETINDLKEN